MMDADAGPGPFVERRRALRHACVINATANEQMLHVGEGWMATVVDISTTGIGLHLGEGFPTGCELTLDLHGHNHILEAVCVRVVRCQQQTGGTWHLGAEFLEPLDEGLLLQLIS